GGPSLLNLVVVVLDTIQQIESHLLMRHYDGLVQSGRVRGRSAATTVEGYDQSPLSFNCISKAQYKTASELEQVRKSADVLSQLLAEIAQRVEPGITTLSLDQFAYDFIKDHKGTPAFLNYHGFPYSLCISVNDQVVHGFPSDYVLQEGDIISVDGGVNLNGFISDSAYTFAVGNISAEAQQLLDVTKASLYAGIEQAVAGKRVGDISSAV